MIIQSVVIFFLNLIPEVNLSPGMLDSLTSAVIYAVKIGHYVPLDTFVMDFGILFVSGGIPIAINILLQLL